MRSPNLVTWHVILKHFALTTYCVERWWYDETLGMDLLGDLRASGSLSGLEIHDIKLLFLESSLASRRSDDTKSVNVHPCRPASRDAP